METNKINSSASNKYFVGIGASAGGLEAINELFDNMPSNTGFSFFIIQHLSPDHRSLMSELLAKHTTMQVFEAQNNLLPQPNCIYLIPSKKTLTIKNGLLKLADKIRDHQPNVAIDIFLSSLATDKQDKAIGIILSGTGTDGTKGIQAIKNNGGIVIVQDPITAQFDGMPNSAVASGYVDIILSPDMMGDEMLEYLKESPLLRSFNTLSNQEEAILLDILKLIYDVTGHNFSNYKRPTINRRLAKRMAERNHKSLNDYLDHLKKNPEEIKKLCKEFLLHVTQFFRDGEAFDKLKDLAISDIVEKKEPGDVVKFWSVACSTGEEAYTLAILLDECLQEQNKHNIEIKIFASDISQAVIDFASKGLYSVDQVKNISPERLKKYFIIETGGYRVIPAIRKMIVFARHDISQDPPFSKIDLLTCRNMLIYMNPILQKSILRKFHFSINDGGYLFLGASENIGSLKEVMQETDKRWKIYKCISKIRISEYESFTHPVEKNLHGTIISNSKAKNAFNNLSEIFKESLLFAYDYAGILIDKDFEVKQAIGNFKKFLAFPESSFNFNLLKLVPQDLSIALSTAIRRAIKDNEKIVLKHINVNIGAINRQITVIINPYLVQKTYLQPFIFIILKEDEVTAKKPVNTYLTAEGYTNERMAELELELVDTKANLQALIEEVESSNEELQSSNEEIISANEELQSTNEELQSLNEELHTVNAEHQFKIRELIELNDDLNNYFQNTNIGQILIDKKLIIRKFTPIATKQVNLISSDIGRSIVDISTNIKNFDLVNEIKHVILNGHTVEREIAMEDGKTYLMRIASYLRQNKTSDGVVINFIDVSEVKKLNTILEAVFNSSTSGIIAMNAIRNEQNEIEDFEIITTNKAAVDMMETEGNVLHMRLTEVYPALDPQTMQRYKNVVHTGENLIFEYQNPDNKKWFDIIAVKMIDGLVITFNDTTERKKDSETIKENYKTLTLTLDKLKDSNYKLEQSNLDLIQFASVASHDLKEPLRKIQAFGNLLNDRIKTKIDSTETNYLNKVINSTNRMQVLIDDILTLSRLSKNDTPHTAVDLNEVVLQIIEDLEISITEKNASIKVETLPVVKGIVGQMHQLFQNLISNAIKFNQSAPHITISQGEISKELAAEFAISPNDYYKIYVSDDGIGFDKQYSEKIFGIFQRLDKTHFQGTGIGLAIVKKITDNHKGFIKAISEPDKGSTFILLLPK